MPDSLITPLPGHVRRCRNESLITNGYRVYPLQEMGLNELELEDQFSQNIVAFDSTHIPYILLYILDKRKCGF